MADAYLTEEARDLTLFHYYGCFFCESVREVLGELGLVIAERNIFEDPDAMRELIGARGRRTVPVLRIEQEDGSYQYMGESRDIARYLRTRSSGGD